MYRFSMIFFTICLAFSIGCGKYGKDKPRATEKQPEPDTFELAPHGTQGRFATIDMALRWTSQMGEFMTFEKDQNQEIRIQEVYTNFADKMKEIRFYGPGKVMTDGEWQEMRNKIETIFAERDQKIRAILLDHQLPKYDEFLKAMQQKNPE